MKPEIHPQYKDVKVVCSCGSTFITRSTLDKDQLSLEVCAMCHPFYTGTQKIMDTAGRVDRFRQKYSRKKPATEDVKASEETKTAAPAKAAKASKPTAKTTKAKSTTKKETPKKDAAKKSD